MAVHRHFGLGLAEKALAQAEGALVRAALDVSTGYGVDAYFTDPDRSEWDEQCVHRFVDVLIQHDSTVYPVFSRDALDPTRANYVPSIFAATERRAERLLALYRDRTADDIELTKEELHELWRVFEEWARQPNNAKHIKRWIRERHADGGFSRRRHYYYYYRSAFRYIDLVWSSIRSAVIRRFLQVTEADLRDLFDVFCRTVRYQCVLGDETLYFPHPLRDAARVIGHASFDGVSWSWGKFLTNAMTAEERRSPEWLLDQIDAIRGAARRIGDDASWYSLAKEPRSAQAEIIREIAFEARLPAYMTTAAQRDLLLFGSATAAATAFLPQAVNVTVTLFMLLGGVAMTREVPEVIARRKIVRGYLHWPGLLGN